MREYFEQIKTPIPAEMGTALQIEDFIKEDNLIGLKNVAEMNDFSTFREDKKFNKLLKKCLDRLSDQVLQHPEQKSEYGHAISKLTLFFEHGPPGDKILH